MTNAFGFTILPRDEKIKKYCLTKRAGRGQREW
jgi:hypothetical protein